VFPVRYELGFYIPEDVDLHSDGRENPKSYKLLDMFSNSSRLSQANIGNP
jgi:hypothetical protein